MAHKKEHHEEKKEHHKKAHHAKGEKMAHPAKVATHAHHKAKKK